MTNRSIQFGRTSVGTGYRPLFLPDIGTFFNQDMTLAGRVIDSLAESGVTVVKGEILHTPEICLKHGGVEKYYGWKSGTIIEEDYRALIERKVVSFEAYEKLFSICHAKDMEFVVSVYDFEGADFAKSIGAIALKIASSNITHQPLIEHAAKSRLPVIIDTGHSSMEEVARAVSWAQDSNAVDIVVQHSPLAPPNPLSKHNLKYMQTLGRALCVPYGLSDHHCSEEMLYAATAMGACVLEKGVCPDRLGDEQDTGHALPLSMVKDVIGKINNIYEALGDGERYLPRSREKYISRMGLVAKKDLQSGDKVDLDSVTFAFPATGIPVEFWGEVCGWKINTIVPAGSVIEWKHVSDLAS